MDDLFIMEDIANKISDDGHWGENKLIDAKLTDNDFESCISSHMYIFTNSGTGGIYRVDYKFDRCRRKRIFEINKETDSVQCRFIGYFDSFLTAPPKSSQTHSDSLYARVDTLKFLCENTFIQGGDGNCVLVEYNKSCVSQSLITHTIIFDFIPFNGLHTKKYGCKIIEFLDKNAPTITNETTICEEVVLTAGHQLYWCKLNGNKL